MNIKSPKQIVDLMYNNDPFSNWMGMERIEEGKGYCCLKMEIRADMLNGFGIAHGGIAYSLADSALAFAANSHGRKALSIETSINHLLAVKEGDILMARATEESCTNKIGVYRIIVENAQNEKVAVFKGVVYRTTKLW